MARLPRLRLKGTTLVELLMAVLFLGVAAAAILNTTTGARTSATYAMRRAAVLTLVEDQINDSRRVARTSALLGLLQSSDTNVYTVTVPGIPGTVRITRVTSVGLLSNMYDVTAAGTWTESTATGTRSDRITITTQIRAPQQ